MSATKIAAGDPAKVPSQNYKVLLENNRMRALEYRSKPGEKTVMHSHGVPCVLFHSFSNKNHHTHWHEHRI